MIFKVRAKDSSGNTKCCEKHAYDFAVGITYTELTIISFLGFWGSMYINTFTKLQDQEELNASLQECGS